MFSVVKTLWKKMSIVKHLKKGERREISGEKSQRHENEGPEKLDVVKISWNEKCK